jgi:catechol 2,3-dioxygenase-like lactoylglutathione lyase family enzyme
MLNIRHTGIYVEDIAKQAEFYKKCFFMTIICENYQDSGPLFDDLLGYKEAKVLITLSNIDPLPSLFFHIFSHLTLVTYINTYRYIPLSIHILSLELHQITPQFYVALDIFHCDK